MEHNQESLLEFGPVIIDELSRYLQECQSGNGPVLKQESAGLIAEELNLNQLLKDGFSNEKAIRDFLHPYLKYTQRLQHPHFVGHQTSIPNVSSAFADFVHGIVNNPMSIFEMGPSAAVLERFVINWMLQKAGWFKGNDPGDFRPIIGNGIGILTHGGSMANLTALLSARSYAADEVWEEGVKGDLVVLAPSVSHYSVSRAISIMGLGKKAFIPINVDENEVMLIEDLGAKIEEQLAIGNRIVAVIANACATTTGLFDPIDEIGDICRKHNVWLHVDGAHGASALLSDSHKHLMKGLDKANSLTWDAHKMLQTSTLCAAVLYRQTSYLSETFQQKASYLFHEKDSPGFDTLPYQIECTKSSLGTKLFFAIAAKGEAALSSYVEKMFSFTKAVYRLIASEDDFECPCEPESNILCFRYIPAGKENEAQLKLRNKLVDRGNFYITSSEFKHKRYLRLSLMNPITNLQHIKNLMEEIRLVNQLLSNH